MGKVFDPMFSYAHGLSMDLKTAQSLYHRGNCDNDIETALPEFEEQFKTIDSADIRQELKEYGAWDEEELSDDYENKKRILWIAASNIVEEYGRG